MTLELVGTATGKIIMVGRQSMLPLAFCVLRANGAVNLIDLWLAGVASEAGWPGASLRTTRAARWRLAADHAPQDAHGYTDAPMRSSTHATTHNV